MLEVEVPPGLNPGDVMTVMMPSGEELEIDVPAGCAAGSVILVAPPSVRPVPILIAPSAARPVPILVTPPSGPVPILITQSAAGTVPTHALGSGRAASKALAPTRKARASTALGTGPVTWFCLHTPPLLHNDGRDAYGARRCMDMSM